MKKLFLCLVIFWSSLIVLGEIFPEEVLMNYLSFEDVESNELESYLESFTSNRLSWANCAMSDLESLPLNDEIMERVLQLKTDGATVRSWQNLQTLGNFNDEEIELLKYFLLLEDQEFVQNVSLTNFTALVKDETLDLSKNLLRGNLETRFGDRIGFVAERDRNEHDLWDYRNFSLCMNRLGEQIRLGAAAFRFHWGQGLLFSNRSISAKSTNISANVLGSAARFGTYTSSDENRYLSGINVHYQRQRLGLYTFYSQHRIDATLEDSRVKSFRSSGLHDTESGRKAENRLLEKTACSGIRYCNHGNRLGVLVFHTKYSLPVIDFLNAKKQSGVSIFQRLDFGKWLFSGELASLNSGEYALIQGFVYRYSSYKIVFQYRYFSDNFGSRMSAAIKEYSSDSGNESGIYFGTQLKLNRCCRISAYVDFYSQNRSMIPGQPAENGSTSMLYLLRRWTGNHYLTIRYRIKSTEITGINKDSKRLWTVSGCYYLTTGLSLSCRGALAKYITDQEVSQGMATSVALAKQTAHRMKVTLGATHFYIPSAETRIYLYEPGTPFRFNLVSLSGTGYRWFAIVQQDFHEKMSMTITYKTRIWRRLSEALPSHSFIIELQMLVDL